MGREVVMSFLKKEGIMIKWAVKWRLMPFLKKEGTTCIIKRAVHEAEAYLGTTPPQAISGPVQGQGPRYVIGSRRTQPNLVEDDKEVIDLAVEVATDGDLLGDWRGDLYDIRLTFQQLADFVE